MYKIGHKYDKASEDAMDDAFIRVTLEHHYSILDGTPEDVAYTPRKIENNDIHTDAN